MRIHFLCIALVISLLVAVPFSYAQTDASAVLQCQLSIDSAFSSLLKEKNRELEAIFSSSVPTADLLDESLDYLRETYDQLDGVCGVLRTGAQPIPFNLALSQNITACADKYFDVRQSMDLALYCDREKTEKLSALKDHARSFLMRDSKQEKATRIIEKYQETNLKLQGLSEDAIRFVQYIGKFNSAIGGVITKTCQQ